MHTYSKVCVLFMCFMWVLFIVALLECAAYFKWRVHGITIKNIPTPAYI